jgi:hypothetical protein
MAQAGTLLSDLNSGTPGFNNNQDDIVNQILTDINSSSNSNPIMNAPPPSGNGRVISSPNPNSIYPMMSDSSTASAHVIGKDYPTTSDFAQMMHSPQYTNNANFGGMNNPYVQQQQQQLQQPTLVDMSKVNIYSQVITQIKQPLFVAIIVFIVSLPIVNVLIGHYIPSLLRVGGDLTTAGLVVKALVGGFLFWFIQKVVVPLMAV